jgi:hypothetical protein
MLVQKCKHYSPPLCNLWKLAERDRLVLLIVKGEKRPACGISFGAVSKAGNGDGEGGRRERVPQGKFAKLL